MIKTITNASEALIRDAKPIDEALCLQLGECQLRLRSNSGDLISRLKAYFGHVAEPCTRPDIEILAVEREAPELDIAFIDWKREPGKTGRKDAYADLPGGRLVRKVRTGMVFLQGSDPAIAAGPCLQYDNQVINFINAQYMNWLQNRGWLICHAAALTRGGNGYGIAGFSGGGKSTLMLHLLEENGFGYLTNDRLFIRTGDGGIDMRGIPKLPRVNPGTIVHNPRLHSLIGAEERARLLALPQPQLWEIEKKYDVDVEQVYGQGSISQSATLSAFLILNWQRDCADPPTISEVDLNARPELLGAVMKSPGPFYQYPDSSFLKDDMPLEPGPYLDALSGVTILEASGGIDFDALTSFCKSHWLD